MPVTEIKRPNFYEGQYLGAADLIAAQEYQRQQDQRHRLGGHTWGISVGLELKEVSQPGGAGAVDVYLQPGYAWDGFGRAIVVLTPYKIPEALFAQFKFNSAQPEGQWIPIWLRYREEKTNPPAPGFALCSVEDQAYRVLETFQVVVGELPLISQQRDQISVAGKMDDAGNVVADSSVPYQALPDSTDGARWLIEIGRVRWLAPNPPFTSTGHFVQSAPNEPRTREGRSYIGVIAEAVLAPAGKLRIRDRKNPQPLTPETPELMGIEGSLRVDGISHFRGLVITDNYVNIDSQNLNVGDSPGGAPLGGPALTFGLFSLEGIASKRTAGGNQNGLDFYTGNKAHLSIANDGNVGIGTSTPNHKFHVLAEDAVGLFESTGTQAFLRLSTKEGLGNRVEITNRPGGRLSLWTPAGDVLNITKDGLVGIGTIAPTKKLEVVGDLQVSGGGNIFVGNTMIPIHTPVDVVTGERILNVRGDQTGSNFAQGIDFFTLTSRLGQVGSASIIVALSDISNEDVATWARWRVSPFTSNPIPPNSFQFGIHWRVDDIDGHLFSYSFVVVFVP